nr:Chain C, mQ [synthetic construct]6Y2B_C Chain C, mQ [synthetic construct]
GRLNQPIKV